MIKAIEVYLVTNGNGMEAVEFYKNALDAEVIAVMQWKDGVPNCPKENEHLLMNAQLSVNGIRLMISDDNPEYSYRSGTNMSACIQCDSMETAQNLYDKMSVGAQEIQMELGKTFWSPAYASLIDRFGMHWQINTEIKEN